MPLGDQRVNMGQERRSLLIDAIVEPFPPDDPGARLDRIAVTAQPTLRIDHLALLGKWQGGCHARSFVGTELGGGLVEVSLRASLRTVGPNPGFCDIEIDLHDPPFAPYLLDPEGEPGFQTFAEIAATLPQKDVLGGLLGDRRTAAQAFALGIVECRRRNRFGIKAVMLAELGILGRNHRRDEVAIDIGQAFPILGDAMFVHQHGRSDRDRHEFEQDDQGKADPDEPQDGLGNQTGEGADQGKELHCVGG